MMIQQLSRWLVVVLVSMLLVMGVQAQETLEPGVEVEGEITQDTTAVEYTYNGTAGEVVVIELFPMDVLADYGQPAIVLLGSDGRELLRREGFGETTAIWQLPDDGAYTVVATRAEGATDSVGEYTLTVRQPDELALGDVAEGEIDAETNAYFVYRGEDDFMLNYERDGDFAPEISVNTILTDFSPGGLDTRGAISGSDVTQGRIGVFSGGTVYVLKLGQSLLDFSFENPTASYRVALVAPAE